MLSILTPHRSSMLTVSGFADPAFPFGAVAHPAEMSTAAPRRAIPATRKPERKLPPGPDTFGFLLSPMSPSNRTVVCPVRAPLRKKRRPEFP